VYPHQLELVAEPVSFYSVESIRENS